MLTPVQTMERSHVAQIVIDASALMAMSRYLENQIRERFGFEDTAIGLVFKPCGERE